MTDKKINNKNFFSKRKCIIFCIVLLLAFLSYREYRNGSIFIAFVSGMSKGLYNAFSNNETGDTENNTIDENEEGVRKTRKFIQKIKNSPAVPPKQSPRDSIIYKEPSPLTLSPFHRKLSPAELEILGNKANNKSINVSYKKVEQGCFAGYDQTTLKDSSGSAIVFVHKGEEVFQFAYFPPIEQFAEADVPQRLEKSHELFKILFEKVYGEGEYEKNKDLIHTSERNFTDFCSQTKIDMWVYTLSHGYTYACTQYGVAVMQDSALSRHDLSPQFPMSN